MPCLKAASWGLQSSWLRAAARSRHAYAEVTPNTVVLSVTIAVLTQAEMASKDTGGLGTMAALQASAMAAAASPTSPLPVAVAREDRLAATASATGRAGECRVSMVVRHAPMFCAVLRMHGPVASCSWATQDAMQELTARLQAVLMCSKPQVPCPTVSHWQWS